MASTLLTIVPGHGLAVSNTMWESQNNNNKKKCPNEGQKRQVLVLTAASPSQGTQQHVPSIQMAWAAGLTSRFGGERGLLYSVLYSPDRAGSRPAK